MNPLLAEIAALLGDGWAEPTEVATLDVLPAALAVSDLAVGSVAAASLAAAELSRARGGPFPAVTVDGRAVSAVFRSDRLVEVDGLPVQGFAQLSRFWQTGDGWIRTHANYPHHRQRLLTVLGLGQTATVEQVAARFVELSAAEAEAEIVAAGGICVAVRAPGQWRTHPQDVAIRKLPLLSSVQLGDAQPRDLPPPPRDPLLPAAGLRVLDLTRVIAGPAATTTLALLGAEVLRVDAPNLPELPEMHVLNGMGKRSALLDLRVDADVLLRLVRTADVVVTGYRPGSLERYGLSPEELAVLRPGLVVAVLSAWGAVGPWGNRRGFDSIVQAASGIAVVQSTDGHTPGALPAQALDYSTGFLLAAGILAAIARQQREGGTFLVQAHLARTASWLLDHPDDTPRQLPDTSGRMTEGDTAMGRVRYPLPPIDLVGGPVEWSRPVGVWGRDEPRWLSLD